MKKNYLLIAGLLCIFCVSNESYADNINLSDTDQIQKSKISIIMDKFKKNPQEKNEQYYNDIYIPALTEKYNQYNEEQKYKKSLKIVNKINKISNNVFGNDSLSAVESNINRANLYIQLYQSKIAQEYLNQDIDYIQSCDNKDIKLKYYEALFNLYSNKSDYNNILKTAKEIEKIPNLTTDEKLDVYSKFINIYIYSNNFKKAEEFLKNYYNLVIKNYGTNSQYLSTYYKTLINIAMRKSEFKKIPSLCEKLKNIQTAETEHDIFINQLEINNIMFRYYIEILEYNKAKEIITQNEKIIKKLNDKTYDYLLFNDYLNYYKELKEYENYKKCFKEKYTMHKKLFRNDISQDIFIEDEKANIYKDIQQYKTALKAATKALNLIKGYEDELPMQHIQIIQKISENYNELNKTKEAMEYAKKELSLSLSIMPENRSNLIEIYKLISDIYLKENNTTKGIKYRQMALKEYEEIYGKIHSDIAEIYSDFADIYSSMHKFSKAITNINKSIDITEKIYGKNHAKVYNLLRNKANIYNQMNKNKESEEINNYILRNYQAGNIIGYDFNLLYSINIDEVYKNKSNNNYDTALNFLAKAKEYAKEKWMKEEIKSLEKELRELSEKISQ